MITIVFTETHLVAFGNNATQPHHELVNAELAGRSYPMTSTMHVFLNTLINRYKDFSKERVRYPIDLKIVFPTKSYFATSERRHLLAYLQDRSELFKVTGQQSIMGACISGWQLKNKSRISNWVAFEVESDMTIGLSPSESDGVYIKTDPVIGRKNLLEELKIWAKDAKSVQEAVLLSKLSELTQKDVAQIFNTHKLALNFTDSEEVPSGEIHIDQEFVSDILNIASNRIFLHINNYNSKLPDLKSVFIFGSFTDHEVLKGTLQNKVSESDYELVFLNSDRLTRLAASGITADENNFSISTEQTLSTPANSTSTNIQGISNDSSPQSHNITQITKRETTSTSTEVNGSSLFSKEFVVEKRIPDQEFMLFWGFRRGIDTKYLYRYVSHEDYKSMDRATAFNSIYRKERILYRTLGSVVNGKSGKYYIIPVHKAKSLRSTMTQSRMNTNELRKFKSEDLQFILDLYKAIKRLPITFTNLTLDNIHVRRREWWRRNSQNEFYFFGITSEYSSTEHMIDELDKLLQSLIHPTIIDHITNFKNEI